MWIFLNDAFVSAVQLEDQPDKLMVRARVAGDLSRFFGRKIEETFTQRTDYRYRVVVDRVEFADALMQASTKINYRNFKNSVKAKDRHDRYHEVWWAMYDFQNDRLKPVEVEAAPKPIRLPGIEVKKKAIKKKKG